MISEVLVEGITHVEKQEILDVIETQIGDDLASPATKWQLRDDYRAVWALGYFNNIVFSTERSGTGWNLIIQVEEKPIVAELRYEGNERYKKKKLDKEIAYTGKERIFFTKTATETLKQKIVSYYTRQSFPNTTVTWHTEELTDSEIALIFVIKEGKRLPVKKIAFSGNTSLRDKQLLKRILTKKSWWFIIKHHYDNAIVEEDLERIKYTYWDNGYLDVSVKKGPVEEIKNGLKVNFIIEEGKPYTIGDIAIEGNTIFSDAELLSKITFQPGDGFSAGTLSSDELELLNLYRAQGYLNTNVQPLQEQLKKDETEQIVDIHIQLTEAQRKYLGKIEIQGVVTLDAGTVIPTQEGEFKTKDFVIEREIELTEGEPLDWTKVIESDRNLVNLNFFRTAGLPAPGRLNLYPGFERKPTTDPNVENLLLRLEETQTGMLSFGGGVSTSFGPSVFTTLSERNLFGLGVRGSVTGELGKYRNRLSLNVFEPHLMNSDYSLDWDIYYLDTEGYGGRRFDEERIGTSFTFGKELSDELTLLFGTKIERTDLNPSTGHRYELDQTTIPEEFNLGENTTTSLLFGAIYDARDFKIDPTSGYLARSLVEVAGLTDNEFIKLENEANYYHPIYKRLILALSAELDLAYAYGDPGFIPLQERFFVGGARTIRGFDEGGIGPYADILYKNPSYGGFRTYLGGEASFVSNVELRYPLTEIFQVVSFLDMGSVWPEISDIDPSDFRFSTGAGVRVRIPGMNALIRLDFPMVLRKFDDDDTEIFHFSFGQTF